MSKNLRNRRTENRHATITSVTSGRWSECSVIDRYDYHSPEQFACHFKGKLFDREYVRTCPEEFSLDGVIALNHSNVEDVLSLFADEMTMYHLEGAHGVPVELDNALDIILGKQTDDDERNEQEYDDMFEDSVAIVRKPRTESPISTDAHILIRAGINVNDLPGDMPSRVVFLDYVLEHPDEFPTALLNHYRTTKELDDVILIYEDRVVVCLVR